jgi:hypothetical protein
MQYICKRCNYTTNRKSSLLNHLNKKKTCKVTHEDISCEDLIIEVNNMKYEELKNKEPKIYKCVYCNKIFGHSSNFYRHKRTCKHANQIVSMSKAEYDNLQRQLVEVKEEINSIKGNIITSSQAGTGNTIQNANTINNHNNNNNITNNNNINNYYDVNKPMFSEKLFTLDEQIKLIKEAADDPVTFGMSAYHREKYFNENRKELQCIKLTPDLLQKNKIGIYNGQYWEEKDLHKLLPQITDEAGKFVGIILYDGKTAFQIDRAKNVEMRGRVDNIVLNQTPEEESNQILDKMTDDFVKYTEKIHRS